MDKTSGSSFRATPATSGTPQNQDPANGSDATGKPPGELCVPCPEGVKLRVLPPGAGEADPARELDLTSVFKGALATMTGQGLCFGTAFATINHLRADAKASPRLKCAAGGLLPAIAGYLTAPAQRATYKLLDYESTQMPEPSMWHEAIPSFALGLVNYGYLWSGAKIPKPVPGTPAAAGVTFMLSMIGTGLAGAAAEGTAQWAGGQPAPIPDDKEVHRKGVGRAACLVPMGAANCALQLGMLPANGRLLPLHMALAFWILRNPASDWLMGPPSSPTIAKMPPTPDGAAPHEPPPGHDT